MVCLRTTIYIEVSAICELPFCAIFLMKISAFISALNFDILRKVVLAVKKTSDENDDGRL